MSERSQCRLCRVIQYRQDTSPRPPTGVASELPFQDRRLVECEDRRDCSGRRGDSGAGTMGVGVCKVAGGVIGLMAPDPISDAVGAKKIASGCGTILAGAGAAASGWRR